MVNTLNTKQTDQFQPVLTPSAWHSKQYSQNTDWLVKLSQEQLKELRATVDLHSEVGEDAIHTLTASDFPLPTLGPTLQQVRNDVVNGKGFAIVQGISTAEYNLRCDRRPV